MQMLFERQTQFVCAVQTINTQIICAFINFTRYEIKHVEGLRDQISHPLRDEVSSRLILKYV